jgi:hypothetical protein
VQECKTEVAAEKRRIVQQKIRERRAREMFRSARPGAYKPPAGQRQQPTTPQAPGTEGYQGIFAPGNLKGQVDSEQQEEADEQQQIDAPGTEGYRNIFDPSNLESQVESDKKEAPQKEQKIEAPGTEGYRNIFDPSNLKGQVGGDR